jgi:hypothetical protein
VRDEAVGQRRVIGPGAGLIFKGSGFYITDYRSEGYKEAAKKESSTATPVSGGDGKPTGVGDTKASKGKTETKAPGRTGSQAPRSKSESKQ